ncbi:MAG: PAS domain-containing protein [Deltaproteobacteria bacterium]|nr:PAS domain-containing protein [Deltaproteobacteria bacterium]
MESLTGYPKEEFNTRKKRWVAMVVEEDLEAAKKTLVDVLKSHEILMSGSIASGIKKKAWFGCRREVILFTLKTTE